MTEFDPYATLGVATDAPEFVIQAAYRACLKKYHPDHYSGGDARQRTADILEAYRLIGTPESRSEFDRYHQDRCQSGGFPEGESAGRSTGASVDQAPVPIRNQKLEYWSNGIWLAGLGIVIALVLAWKAGTLTSESHQSEEPTKATNSRVDPPAASSVPTPTPTAALQSECRGISCRVMTPFGWGGIEAGVTTDSAQRASGLKIRDDGHYTDAGDGTCLAYEVVGGPKNLQMLVENGVVTTVEAYLEPTGAVFRTDRGVKLGDPEFAVRKAYNHLKQLPDIYSEPPDKKLFYYEPGGERGIKFSINGGKVTGISVGSRSIEYVEGCL